MIAREAIKTHFVLIMLLRLCFVLGFLPFLFAFSFSSISRNTLWTSETLISSAFCFQKIKLIKNIFSFYLFSLFIYIFLHKLISYLFTNVLNIVPSEWCRLRYMQNFNMFYLDILQSAWRAKKLHLLHSSLNYMGTNDYFGSDENHSINAPL